MNIRLLVVIVIITFLGSPAGRALDAQQAGSFVVVNATIVDGTGAPRRTGSLRVSNGRIAEIGNLTPAAG